jgi:hypothetical protein
MIESARLMRTLVHALAQRLAMLGTDYELLALDGKRAHLRFIGPFEGQDIVWDAHIEALGRASVARYIDVGAQDVNGIALRVGLPLDALNAAALAMCVRMIRQYKLLRRGRYAFDDRGPVRPQKIISGGQTGVDRAALDAAIALTIPCGGYCPRGRRAEDGPIPVHYPLTETASADYPERTARNVREADGTLILTRGAPSTGTALTRELAQRHGKPCLVIDLDTPGEPRAVGIWLARHGIRTLNVAGPRESSNPGIYRQASDFLRRVLTLHI